METPAAPPGMTVKGDESHVPLPRLMERTVVKHEIEAIIALNVIAKYATIPHSALFIVHPAVENSVRAIAGAPARSRCSSAEYFPLIKSVTLQ